MEAGKWRKGGIAMADISIIGAGSWGIALALLLHKNGHHITVWSIIQEEIDMLSKEHEHKEKLPGVKLPEDMEFTTDLEAAVKGKDILVLAVPSPFTRSTSHSMKEYVGEGQVIVNVAKGIEEKSLLTLSQIIEEEIPQAKVAVLSGPSHAEEVGRGIPTTIVVGAKEKTTAEWLQNIFMNEAFRVYISPDVLGIELGAALKNVVALAAGIADGLGYGDNTKAALITRGITEIARLGTAMGGRFETFCGLTGIGDLIVTCASIHSRNRRAGILIGKGYSMEEAMKEVKMVVEGVYSAKAAMALAKKYDVQIPIIEQVNAVLFDGKEAGAAVKELMIRDKKLENSDIPWN
jgi:glycerol-3-phosphate dehydrogenase (NAD(P)+)